LAVTTRGTLLAFCEGRKHSRADSGDIDIVLRRSLDGGKTWTGMQVVADMGSDCIGNPCPVVDAGTGTIWLPLTWNLAAGGESKIVQGLAPRHVYLCRSTDDGVTWSVPVEITGQVKRPDWRWYATGPGHGIQLRSGRLLIPCDFSTGAPDPARRDFGSHVIFSDDHGATWQIGGSIEGQVNECAAAQFDDGRVYLNMRRYGPANRRAVAWSSDEGETWSAPALDDALIEPVCQASVLKLAGERVLFCNPASLKRENLTVRLSKDGCRTWPVSRPLWSGPCAYSDLVTLGIDRAGCLFERGETSPYERITWADFGMDWLHGA
jgi:sialidase-1